MIDRTLGRLLFDGDRLIAHSDLPDDALADAEIIRQSYGLDPAVAALFRVPWGKSHIALGRTLGTKFHLLRLHRDLSEVLSDPFFIAERVPPEWSGSLAASEWPIDVPPVPRRAADLQAILKAGDGPFLLGAAQLLCDNGRVMLHATTAEPERLRNVWMLLPERTRAELNIATYAPVPGLVFHLTAGPWQPPPGVRDAEGASEYPAGAFELGLQSAIEAGDEQSVAQLLARRSSHDTFRLGLWVLGGMLMLVPLMGLLRKLLQG